MGKRYEASQLEAERKAELEAREIQAAHMAGKTVSHPTETPEKQAAELERKFGGANDKADEGLVMAKRIYKLNTGVVYHTRDGARVYGDPGDCISDMCQNDWKDFLKRGIISTEIVVVDEGTAKE